MATVRTKIIADPEKCFQELIAAYKDLAAELVIGNKDALAIYLC